MLWIKRIWNTTRKSRFKHFQFASMLIKSLSPSLQGHHPIVSRVETGPPFDRVAPRGTWYETETSISFLHPCEKPWLHQRHTYCQLSSYAKMLWSPLVENLQRIEKGRSFVLLCLGKGWVESGVDEGPVRSVCCEIGYRPRGLLSLLCKCYTLVTGAHTLRENPWLPRVSVTGCDRCRCDQMISGWERRGGDD